MIIHMIPQRKSNRVLTGQVTGLCIEAGEYGDIFWDCVTNTWSCKSTAAAKRLFQSLDLKNMENQVLRRYGFRFKAEDMTSLAKAWGKEKRKSAG